MFWWSLQRIRQTHLWEDRVTLIITFFERNIHLSQSTFMPLFFPQWSLAHWHNNPGRHNTISHSPRRGSVCVLGGRGAMERAWDIIIYDIGREKTTRHHFRSGCPLFSLEKFILKREGNCWNYGDLIWSPYVINNNVPGFHPPTPPPPPKTHQQPPPRPTPHPLQTTPHGLLHLRVFLYTSTKRVI